MKVIFTLGFMREANKRLTATRVNDLVEHVSSYPSNGDPVRGLPTLFSIQWDECQVIYHYILGNKEIHFIVIGDVDEDLINDEPQRVYLIRIIKTCISLSLKTMSVVKIAEFVKEHWDDIKNIPDLFE